MSRRDARHDKHGRQLVSAAELGEDFSPNRAQRRDYVRRHQTRTNRMHLIGFGRWRRPHTSETRADSWASLTAIEPQPLRRERRPAMIAAYRKARKLRLLQQRGSRLQ